jgi:signal transduction histidine kinase
MTPGTAAAAYPEHVSRSRIRTLLVDAGLAGVLGAVMVGPYYAGPDGPTGPRDGLVLVFVGVVTAALVLRRVQPWVALGGVVAAVAAHLVLGYPDGPILLGVPVAVYSVAAGRPVRRSLAACGVCVLALAGADMPDATHWLGPSGPLVEWVVVCGLAPWAVGAVIRMERAAQRAAQEHTRREVVHRERLQIAHDVHDSVGHGLAAISMQAGVALHVLDRSPQRTRELLQAIRGSSQSSLDELRSTLAVFRSPDVAGDRSPAPGLTAVDALVARTAAAGLPVEVLRRGELGRLPATVDRAAYRIVQEGLANVLRHAGPASATVRLERDPATLTVTVADTGRGAATASDGPSPRPADGPGGQGIIGMRARAEAVGGTLIAGPRPTGGFALVARLPVAGRP